MPSAATCETTENLLSQSTLIEWRGRCKRYKLLGRLLFRRQGIERSDAFNALRLRLCDRGDHPFANVQAVFEDQF